MFLTGKALLAGVIGFPVAHSLSPRLHGYWLEQYQIDGAYIPLLVNPDDLGDVIRALPKMGFRGVNITVPHKETVMQYVDEVDSIARRIGAVNTLVVKDGKIHATNTDAFGFIENIKAACPAQPWVGGKAVVLGAGGAARAVCAALQEAGVEEIILTNRTAGNARKLQYDLGDPIAVAPWTSRREVLEGAHLLVNTTTLGMAGYPALEIELDQLPAQAVVSDIVYKPLETALLTQAKLRGNVVVDGLGMLLHQAVAGFEAWFGVKPQVTRALREHMLQS